MRRLTAQYIQDLIQDLNFQPLTIKFEKQSTSQKVNGKAEADARLVIGWKNNSENFVAEFLSQATPKEIEMGIFRLEKKVKETGKKKKSQERIFPIIIAPYLSDQILNRLMDAEISGIDLSGNGVVVVPDELFVYRAGAKNKFLSNTPIKNIFRGTSSLAARVFFAQPEYESVGDVLEEITKREGSTTFSTVSKVLKILEEELIIAKGEKIRLLNGKKLLNFLLKNYRQAELRRNLSFKCADLTLALEQLSENAKRKKILLAWDYPERYTVMPSGASTIKIYTESIDELMEGVEFTETSRFPDIKLFETSEPTIYFDRRKDKDVYLLSPLQTYLMLATEGKREQEAAFLMIERLLDFKY